MTILLPRRSKAQARWKLLRHAILSSAASSSPASSSSLPPHTSGIRSYTLPLPCPSTSSQSPLTIAFQIPTPSPPSSLSSTCLLPSSLAALVSHRSDKVGVDNTGNVRVWPAEEALLLVLLKEGLDKQTGITRRPRRILELGAGCTGLLGLGLAMAWGGDCVNGGPSSPSTVKTQATSPPSTTTHVPSQLDPPDAIQSMYVCLTDGHPDCLSSLRKCVALNQTRLPSGARVEVQRLVWKEEEQERKKRDMTQECQEQLHDDDGNESSHPQGCREPFDLIVAADVLFFERFHRALLHTLHTHLHPEGGEAWFLQPSRGGSLERFVALVKKEGGLEVVWEGERGGIQTGGDDGDDLGSAQLQLLKLRCMRQTNGGVNP